MKKTLLKFVLMMILFAFGFLPTYFLSGGNVPFAVIVGIIVLVVLK
ncbi:MAG: hypothetical protein ACOCXG_02840 [Nanoarchaeota archaeon]